MNFLSTRLNWGSETQYFSGAMVKQCFDHLDFLIWDLLEIRFLGKVLSYELVGILDRSSLPGGIGPGEEDGYAKRLGCGLMGDEFAAVVVGEGLDGKALEGRKRLLVNLCGRLSLDLSDSDDSALAVDEGEHLTSLVFADDEIALEIPESLSLLDELGPFFGGKSGIFSSRPSMGPEALSAASSVRVSEMVPEGSSGLLVSPKIAIDGFHADWREAFESSAAGNLFGAPLELDATIHPRPKRSLN